MTSVAVSSSGTLSHMSSVVGLDADKGVGVHHQTFGGRPALAIMTRREKDAKGAKGGRGFSAADDGWNETRPASRPDKARCSKGNYS